MSFVPEPLWTDNFKLESSDVETFKFDAKLDNIAVSPKAATKSLEPAKTKSPKQAKAKKTWKNGVFPRSPEGLTEEQPEPMEGVSKEGYSGSLSDDIDKFLGPLGFDFGGAEEVARVQSYRANYHSFRKGNAFGSKGEPSDVVGKPAKRTREEMKAMHRQVERRRTRRLNDLIYKLKVEVTSTGVSVRKDKASILAAALECIKNLRTKLNAANSELALRKQMLAMSAESTPPSNLFEVQIKEQQEMNMQQEMKVLQPQHLSEIHEKQKRTQDELFLRTQQLISAQQKMEQLNTLQQQTASTLLQNQGQQGMEISVNLGAKEVNLSNFSPNNAGRTEKVLIQSVTGTVSNPYLNNCGKEEMKNASFTSRKRPRVEKQL
eukprot:g3562.t1